MAMPEEFFKEEGVLIRIRCPSTRKAPAVCAMLDRLRRAPYRPSNSARVRRGPVDQFPAHATLARRIAEARFAARRASLGGASAEGPRKGSGRPSSLGRAGVDLGASVVGGALVGWILDEAFGTMPWGLIGMMFLGFIAGFVQILRSFGTLR